MNGSQFTIAILVVLATCSLGAILAFQKGRPRQWIYPILWVCALSSALSYIDFGNFQTISVEVEKPNAPGGKARVRMHRPFHFHEFVHYYLGPKYFSELGYLGLYDCIALADKEIAEEDGTQRRITSYVRDLEDVLVDKTYDQSLADCRTYERTRFDDARWASFKDDIRDLTKLVDDGAWPSVVYDAGFNPPPSLVVVTSRITNLIPIRSGTRQTFVIATSIDLFLLLLAFLFIRQSFEKTTALLVAIYFGSTFISHYSWNGGSVCRFTWITSVAFGLCALKKERWILAGALFGWATCDRLFPLAFGAFAMVPILALARKDPAKRVILKKFAIGFGAVVVVLVGASMAVFGPKAWATFFERIGRHGDVYYVMHIGLKKVLTFRDWVAPQNFHGHDGLARFKDWNLHLRATWHSMWPLVIPLQLLFVAATVAASMKRKPYEAALLGGVMFMFVFNLPANYYFAILTLLPAFLLRGAMTTTSTERRWRDFAAFWAFNIFWMFTFLAPHVNGDAIIHDFYICAAFLGFLVLWLVAWVDPREAARTIRDLSRMRKGVRGLTDVDPQT